MNWLVPTCHCIIDDDGGGDRFHEITDSRGQLWPVEFRSVQFNSIQFDQDMNAQGDCE